MARPADSGDRQPWRPPRQGHQGAGRVAAEHFDALIVREDRNLRGREPGEVAELVAAGARRSTAGGGRCRNLDVVPGRAGGVRLALDQANPGDLVVLCADQVERIVEELQSRTRASGPAGRPA